MLKHNNGFISLLLQSFHVDASHALIPAFLSDANQHHPIQRNLNTVFREPHGLLSLLSVVIRKTFLYSVILKVCNVLFCNK